MKAKALQILPRFQRPNWLETIISVITQKAVDYLLTSKDSNLPLRQWKKREENCFDFPYSKLKVQLHFHIFYFLVLSLLQHLRTEHLSQTIDTSTIDYEKQANEFGDHIIEYATEDSNEVVRFYSVL